MDFLHAQVTNLCLYKLRELMLTNLVDLFLPFHLFKLHRLTQRALAGTKTGKLFPRITHLLKLEIRFSFF